MYWVRPYQNGRWIKIDTHQVPKKYFEYLIGKLDPRVNSVGEVSHKAQPSYQGKARRISYKIYDLKTFIAALEESTDISLETEILFARDKLVRGKCLPWWKVSGGTSPSGWEPDNTQQGPQSASHQQCPHPNLRHWWASDGGCLTNTVHDTGSLCHVVLYLAS